MHNGYVRTMVHYKDAGPTKHYIGPRERHGSLLTFWRFTNRIIIIIISNA